MNDGIAADRMEQTERQANVSKHFLKARIYEEKKNLEMALKEAGICTEISKKAYPDGPV
ncbi:MAG: hypothetical protein GTO54_08280, partial [Nitrososphaeria archaeon]|nr:hypothetical protein [Nitrososphaeria archaeon]